MWFKNLIFYRYTESTDYTQDQLETAFAEHLFTPCKSQELSRYGWVPPHSALDQQTIFSSGGGFLITAQKEEKMLPANVIKRLLNERVSQIESEQARKVYRKEKLQLKDEIVIDLLPRAFSKFQQTSALLLPREGLIVVDSANHKRAEELLNLLRNSLGTLPIVLPDVHQSPAVVMSEWLRQTKTAIGFTPKDECEMKDPTDEGGTIRVKGDNLHSDEMIAHLDTGKQVVKLALEWDETLSFMLQDDLSIKRVKLSDELSETLNQESSEDPLVRLDSDTARLALECQRLYPQLMDAFGGEVQR
ncbi:recombination-associated protein RdgC [Neptunomonas phycophila]|uniref:recombination-associated protein RdgC n=1 Tax=Neptunomonas phycophila TaxID=1572645 RepID=UPI0015C00334|nr:recombination-associated protein RdgC [Neptunomonas phycophila]QLE97959.1 recombination-associated protein RdgC [Neptunomonas phycophila]